MNGETKANVVVVLRIIFIIATLITIILSFTQ